jgi:hypothetical protein
MAGPITFRYTSVVLPDPSIKCEERGPVEYQINRFDTTNLSLDDDPIRNLVEECLKHVPVG